MINEAEIRWANIRHLALDAAGTLIRPVEPVPLTYHRIGSAFGSEFTPDEVKARFKSAFNRLYRGRVRSSESAERESWREVVCETLCDVGDIRGCFERLFEYFAMPEAWELYPDVSPFLDALKTKNVRLSIASNFDSRLRTIIAGHSPLSQFTGCLLSVDVGFKKPAREFYDRLVECSGGVADQFLMIGDDWEADVTGAWEAGISAVWLSRRKSDMEKASKTSYPAVQTLVEIAQKIQE